MKSWLLYNFFFILIQPLERQWQYWDYILNNKDVHPHIRFNSWQLFRSWILLKWFRRSLKINKWSSDGVLEAVNWWPMLSGRSESYQKWCWQVAGDSEAVDTSIFISSCFFLHSFLLSFRKSINTSLYITRFINHISINCNF